MTAYAISFLVVASYWNNHHHLLSMARHSTSGLMWATHLFLFCLSLVPFATAWAGRDPLANAPSSLFTYVCLCTGLARMLLEKVVLLQHGETSPFRLATQASTWRGKAVGGTMTLSAGLGFGGTTGCIVAARLCWIVIVGIWAVPDPRVEAAMATMQAEAAEAKASGAGKHHPGSTYLAPLIEESGRT